MSDIAPALLEGARIFANVQRDKIRYENSRGSTVSVHRTSITPQTEEETLPGIELNNYVKRSQVEEGTHVLVVEHKEHLEKVPEPEVPPTPEELAAFREEKRFMAKLWAGVAAVGIVAVTVAVVVEKRSRSVVVGTVAS